MTASAANGGGEGLAVEGIGAIAHVADLEAAERIAVFDDQARALARTFWPGPLTIVAPVREGSGVCDLARAGLDTVAVRAPAHPVAQALLTAWGGPLVAPSANRSGRPSPTRFDDALEVFRASALEPEFPTLLTVGAYARYL